MIKKYYMALNSLKYSMPMTILAFMIFLEAFVRTKNKENITILVILIITTLLLVLVMFFYYRNKFLISKSLKKVKNIDEYISGGMVNNSYVLDERIITSYKNKIDECYIKDISEYKVTEEKYGNYKIDLICDKNVYNIGVKDKDDARRLAAFIIKHNNKVTLTNITPLGDGTLHDLGADYHG